MRTTSVVLAVLACVTQTSAYGNDLSGQDDVLNLEAAALTAEEMADLRGGINFAFSLPDILAFRFSANQGGIQFGLRSINRSVFFQLPPNPCMGTLAACP